MIVREIVPAPRVRHQHRRAGATVAAAVLALHLSIVLLLVVLVGAGAGMAFLAGTTLLGGEVADEVRGRVFAVVQSRPGWC